MDKSTQPCKSSIYKENQGNVTHADVVRRNGKLTTLGNWQCLFMYSPLFQLQVPFFLLLYAALLKLHFIEQQKKEKITVRAWRSNFQYQNSVIIKSNLF